MVTSESPQPWPAVGLGSTPQYCADFLHLSSLYVHTYSETVDTERHLELASRTHFVRSVAMRASTAAALIVMLAGPAGRRFTDSVTPPRHHAATPRHHRRVRRGLRPASQQQHALRWDDACDVAWSYSLFWVVCSRLSGRCVPVATTLTRTHSLTQRGRVRGSDLVMASDSDSARKVCEGAGHTLQPARRVLDYIFFVC